MIKAIIQKVCDKRLEVWEYINSDNNEIGKTNLLTLSLLSNLTFVFEVIFIFLMPLFLEKWRITGYHFLMMAVVLFFAIVSEIMKRRKIYGKKPVTIAVVGFMFAALAMFTILDTIPFPFASAVFVVVFLVIAPIAFIIPFEYMFLSQIFAVVQYIIVAGVFKDPEIVGRDSFEVVYGAVVGCALYFVVMRLRLSEYKQKSVYRITNEIDFLTGIDNRATSKSKIDQYLALKEPDNACAMIVLDVDRFKEVNDQLGHEKGDEVLKEVADTLKHVFRSGDIVGRFGGDEFIVFLKDVASKELPSGKCAQIQERMKQVLDGKFEISCSMGICFLDKGEALDEEMFRIADEALYEAKAFGRGIYVQHDFEKTVQSGDELPLMVIVDDNLVDRETIGIQFEDKFRIKKFSESREALDFIETHGKDISIILLDLIMPDVDGFELLDIIKSKPEVAWIPVVAVSSDATMEERALQCGAEDMITKPIVPVITKLRVSHALKSAKR